MAVNVNSVISAYQAAAKAVREGKPQAPETPGAEGANGPSFAGMVRDSLERAAELGRKGEEMSLKGIAGEADMRDVVLAVNNAEHALTTVVAVRDKVITAYQEILRMPI